jgi:hypothetical protein
MVFSIFIISILKDFLICNKTELILSYNIIWVIPCQIKTEVQFSTRPLQISMKFGELADPVDVSKNAKF